MPPLVPASMWTRKDIRVFKDGIRPSKENLIKIGSLATATVGADDVTTAVVVGTSACLCCHVAVVDSRTAILEGVVLTCMFGFRWVTLFYHLGLHVDPERFSGVQGHLEQG